MSASVYLGQSKDDKEEGSPVSTVTNNWLSAVVGWKVKLDHESNWAIKLRRAKDLVDIQINPLTILLDKRLREVGYAGPYEAVAVLAHLIAGCQARAKTDVKEGLSYKLGGKRQVLSPARFEKMLSAENAVELWTPLSRALQQIRREDVSLGDLTYGVLGWGDKAKRKWAQEYWSAWT